MLRVSSQVQATASASAHQRPWLVGCRLAGDPSPAPLSASTRQRRRHPPEDPGCLCVITPR